MGPVFPNSLGLRESPKEPPNDSLHPRAAPFFPDDVNICPFIACHSLSRMSLPQPSQGTLWALLHGFFLLRLHQVPLWRNWFSCLQQLLFHSSKLHHQPKNWGTAVPRKRPALGGQVQSLICMNLSTEVNTAGPPTHTAETAVTTSAIPWALMSHHCCHLQKAAFASQHCRKLRRTHGCPS